MAINLARVLVLTPTLAAAFQLASSPTALVNSGVAASAAAQPEQFSAPLALHNRRTSCSCALQLALVEAEVWQELEDQLASTDAASSPPVLTLYRDTNGWCPFCERVWLQLSLKGIHYDEKLIPLQDKPAWYKEMVPTTLVPAVKFAADDAVVWESLDIMRELEQRFPEIPLLPDEGTDARTQAEALISQASELSAAGAKFAYSSRNQSISEEEREGFRTDFVTALGELDTAIAAGGGPFIAGASISLVDVVYTPFLERWAVQLPLTHDLLLRGEAHWPNINGWYEAMERVPAYQSRVRGDQYSWAATVGTFQRMFAPNGTLSEQAEATIKKADHTAATELVKATLPEEGAVDADAAMEAATKVIRNRDAIVADATESEAKSQKHLERLDADEAAAVEAMLAECAVRLLALAEGDTAGPSRCVSFLAGVDAAEAGSIASAAKYVAARLCAPRDLSAAAAALLRATLRQVGSEAERFAWSASGGLL